MCSRVCDYTNTNRYINMVKFLNFLIELEFFQNQCLITKHLYFVYSITAGVYYENYIRLWFRYFAIVLFAASFFLIIISCCFMLARFETLNFEHIASLIGIISVPVGMLLSIFVMYSWRKCLRDTFDTINEYFIRFEMSKKLIPMDRRYEEVDLIRYLTFWYKLAVVLSLLAWFGKLVLCLTTMKTPFEIDFMRDYIYPFPFVESPAIFQYIIIYVLEATTFVPLASTFFGSITFVFAMVAYLKNQVVLLMTEIKTELSLNVKITGLLNENEVKFVAHDEVYDDEKCRQKFAENIDKWIERHQRIILIINKLRGFIQAALSIHLASAMIVVLMFLNILLSARSEGKIIYYIYILDVLPPVLVSCVIGNLFNGMTEDLAEEIYAIPWYHLLPEQRKIVLGFLTLVQKPPGLLAFNVFPLTLSLFPKIISKGYTYVQLMRAMERKM